MKLYPFRFLVFAISILLFSCNEKEVPDPIDDDPQPDPIEFAFGVDLSYVNQIEDNGGIYKEGGVQVDPYEVLQQHGANTVRLRLWHNPAWVLDLYDGSSPLYGGYEDVEKSIMRAKNAGMSTMLDFHYSDIWADPGNQKVPDAWKDITDIQVLADSVYLYTYDVLSRLHANDLLPEMVQIGNETNCGMMFSDVPQGFPSLNVCQNNWQNFGMVVNAAINAIRQVDALADQHTIIALHVADPKNIEWWLRDVIRLGGVNNFDVMGFSYYHIWHNTVAFDALPGLISNMIELYNKDIMLLETAYPFTTDYNNNYSNIYYAQTPLSGFPYTLEGQRDFMVTLTSNLKEAGAKGVFYWEPAWITSDMVTLWGVGSSWENCAFFDFSGDLTEVVEYFTWEY